MRARRVSGGSLLALSSSSQSPTAASQAAGRSLLQQLGSAMARRANRRNSKSSVRPTVSKPRTSETLEPRVVMSANPISGPLFGHHSFVDEAPAITQHAIPALEQHSFAPTLGQAVVESAPAHDPNADFWLGTGTSLDSLDDLGRQIEQNLREGHALTGQNDVVASYGLTGAGQTVAVIDSGIAYNHYALGGGRGEGYRVVGGWDFTENDADFYDDYSAKSGAHGTHVAGIVGAAGGGTHQGVATDVDLVGLRVFDDAGNGYFSWVEQALQWVHTNRNAFDSPITAVNLSLGIDQNAYSVPSWSMLEDEFAQLEADGIFIAVSAGNSFGDYNTKGLSYPAASPHVIPVMASSNDGSLAPFSQRAERAIAAPGRWITSTVPDYAANDGDTIDDDWLSMSGTSMASPYVAGASVLIREAMEFARQDANHTDSWGSIDQWDIFNHMIDTADTFYDSATSTNFERLNLKSAIDAIIPEDDFGSTIATAHNLGTVNDDSSLTPYSSVSGSITTLDDADHFTFTAGATGVVTISAANTTHALTAEWEAWGGTWSTNEAGECVMEVVAGQTYRVGISSAGGLGYYDLQVSLESSFAAIEWGAVSAQETRSWQPTAGETWFSVNAGRTGYFTAEALPQGGSATVAIYDAQQNLLAADASRADVQATAGDTLMLRVTGDASSFDLRMTNALTVSGGTATLVGTAGDDTLAFTAGTTQHSVSLNGVSYAVASTSVSVVQLDGAAGADRLHLTGDAGDDIATLDALTATLQGTGYTATGINGSYLAVVGGGGYDRVDFHDTAADDTITMRPAENDAFMNAGGVFSYASGFERVNAYATAGGYDRIDFWDTAGDDAMTFRPEENDAFMASDTVFGYAKGFERVNAYATSDGYDRVEFLDTSGDDHLTFRPEENDAFFNTGSVFSYASGFERVNARAESGGFDRVDFYDTYGDDHFTFRPEGNDAYFNARGVFSYAIGFERVHAYATSGGYDRVNFTDTADDDLLTFRPDEDDAFMNAGGVFSYAKGFERVHGYATQGGYDRVDFLDTAGDDVLTFRPAEHDAFMNAGGVFSYASGFERLNGYASRGGYDQVDFLDTAGNDLLTFRPSENDAFMSTGSIFAYASGFERANGWATLGGYDRVVFGDTAGFDRFVGRASTNDAYMSGAGYFNYAVGFDRFEARSEAGGSDEATFTDSAGDDHLAGVGSEASLTAIDAAFHAIDFDRVSASSGLGGNDTYLEDSIDFVLDREGAWS